MTILFCLRVILCFFCFWRYRFRKTGVVFHKKIRPKRTESSYLHYLILDEVKTLEVHREHPVYKIFRIILIKTYFNAKTLYYIRSI